MTDIIFNERELAVISESEKRANEHVRAVESSITQLNWILGAVVIVLFVGLLTMIVGIGGIIWTSYNGYRTTLQSLNDELQQKNEKGVSAQIQKIQGELDNLWKNKYPIRR